MRRIKIIALALTVLLVLPLCVSAEDFMMFNYTGYVPKQINSNSSNTEIIEDVNSFIENIYGIRNYYKPKADIPTVPPQYNVPLKIAKAYDIQDDPNFNRYLPGAFEPAPFLYYYKSGCGPDRSQQYLGQTKEGNTITNVRYPINRSWRFLEDLNWVPISSPESNNALKWWHDLGNRLYLSDTLIACSARAMSDSEFALIMDRAISIANMPQLRNWGGKTYYISKIMAYNGNPGQPGQKIEPNLDLLFNPFPWHKYVYIIVPPTMNAWGFGIGFYKASDGYHYKSFPIYPLKFANLGPDFYPASDQTVYTGKPGDKVKVKITLWNKGTYGETDFAYAEYGKGWENATWLDKSIGLGKNGKKEYSAEFTVGETEQKYVFKANVDGKTPENEKFQDNNTLIITVKPIQDIDLAVSIQSINSSYTTRTFPALLGANWTIYRKDKENADVPCTYKVQVIGIKSQDGTDTIPANGKRTGIFLPSYPRQGTYTLKIEAYPTGGFKDKDLTNNTATAKVTINYLAPVTGHTGDSDIHGELGSM